jgi:hypothetical protein
MTSDDSDLQIARLRKKDILFFTYSMSCFVVLLVGIAVYYFYNAWLFVLLIVTLLLLVLWAYSFRKRFREIELRDNFLIISDGKSHIVTTLGSIKHIRTRRILFRKLTFVRFKLDGKNHKIILISPTHHSPGKLLTELKKKKADL